MSNLISKIEEVFQLNKMQMYIIEGLMVAFMALFVFWGIGYFANAIYGMKFELASCWSGLQALGGAGVLAIIKYVVDSCKNSPDGQSPYTSNALPTSFKIQVETGNNKEEQKD